MIFKIKKFGLLIFLILLQSCSGGKIGNFLESSFVNLENVNKAEDLTNILEKKNNIEEIRKEEKIKDETLKDISESKKVLDLGKNLDKTIKSNKLKNYLKNKKNEIQSYRIILILKDVDPKDPMEELSKILRNSEVNFEIEKIERFLDSENQIIKVK